jgi:putative NIF3 family GTP cyclohydrolase 1 type 2
MHIDRFIALAGQIAPPELAMECDEGRIGLVVEGRPEVDRICCALDATAAVVKEAVACRADVLVVHHTPLWAPVTSLTGSTAALLRDILTAGLNLFVMHTNFDRAAGGVNDTLASILGLSGTEAMSLGLVGDCGLTPAGIAARLGSGLRVYGGSGPIDRLAVVGGSGFDEDLIAEAAALGADAFLSSELKHYLIRATPMTLLESTHYHLEAPGMRELAGRMGWTYIDDAPVLNLVP